jgi:hypothetical protein
LNIPYTYLAVLLVFTLFIGVVIGDRLAAGAGEGDDGVGRAGGCTGLASAHLHECVHRYGHLRTTRKQTARSGDPAWQGFNGHVDASCELPEDHRDEK